MWRIASHAVAPTGPGGDDGAPTLNERLGYPADAKLVILSCDDLGSCHAANVGRLRALREGAATCASLMVPAPWARHAAANYEPTDDIGVHLTLNAEHADYRWGPLTHAPSLLSGEGGFPRTLDDLWEHADPDEVRPRAAHPGRAGAGVGHRRHPPRAAPDRRSRCDPSSSTSTSASPSTSPCRYACRPRSRAEQAGFPFRKLAADEGVVFPDHFDHDWRPGSRDRVAQTLANLPAGVTEIHIQPAIDSPEVHGFSAAAEAWIDDLALALDPALHGAARRRGRHH